MSVCFIYETERHNSIADLLEILIFIINGFVLPLKDEHKTLLDARSYSTSQGQKPFDVSSATRILRGSVSGEDDALAEDSEVVLGLLKFWPKVNSPTGKEVMFLSEVEETLDVDSERSPKTDSQSNHQLCDNYQSIISYEIKPRIMAELPTLTVLIIF